MALTLNKVSQAESIANSAVFVTTTDATAAVKTYFHCGFVPRYVKFVNLTDRIIDEFFQGMTADNSLHTIAAGTVSLSGAGGITLETNTLVTVLNSVVMADGTLVLTPVAGTQYVMGFSVPAALMLASKTFCVLALG
jgi:hypothetical protein